MVKAEPKVKAEPQVKKEPKVKAESATKHQSPIKNEPYDNYDQDDSMDTRPGISQGQLNITGVYNIDCPRLADQARKMPTSSDSFRLFICVDNEAGLSWGGFELAWKSGIITIDHVAFGQNLSFGWRARDYEADGSLRSAKGCFGEIDFYGREQVRGVFHNLFLETVESEGTRRPGLLWCGLSSLKFKQGWDAILVRSMVADQLTLWEGLSLIGVRV